MTTPASAPEPPLPPGYLVTVQPGQTVWEIAADAGLSVEELVEVNGLRSADEIAAGQVLFVPAGALPGGQPKALAQPPVPVPVLPPVPPSLDAPFPSAMLWPIEGIVLRDFSRAEVARGKRPPKVGYDGVLIAAPAGSLVRAAAPGVVAFAGTQGTSTGVFVVLEHAGELVTVYAHLKSASVKAGERVEAGDVVGEIGASGLAGVSPRLQFQVRQRKAPIDPLSLLPP